MIRNFQQYACFDWSGQAVARPKGIAAAMAQKCPDDAENIANNVHMVDLLHAERGWSRAEVLIWLEEQAAAQSDMLIGFDVSMGFPFLDEGAFFPGAERLMSPEKLPETAPKTWAFVDEICADEPHLGGRAFAQHPVLREYFRHGRGDEGRYFGQSGIGRLRMVEHWQRDSGQGNSASVFNLVGAAQVGKASLSAMRILHKIRGKIPIWPFDPMPEKGPYIIEIYTSIAAKMAGLRRGSKFRELSDIGDALSHYHAKLAAPLPEKWNDHMADALVTAAWMAKMASHADLWRPEKMTRQVAMTEGWTFGVR